MANSWSARISNSRQVASSEPVANAYPFGKYCKKRKPKLRKKSYFQRQKSEN